MAQTTSDWPRRMSPAAKTPSREVMKLVVATLPRLSSGEAELLDHAIADGAEEAHGEQDEIDVESELGAGLGLQTWAEGRRGRREAA